MRNLLTEVSKMKNIMGLNEQNKPKYSPEVKSIVDLLKDNKVYSAQIQKFINKIEDYSKEGLVDFGLLTRGLKKTLKLKGSKDIHVFEFLKQLTKSLEKRQNKKDKEIQSPEEEPSILPKDVYKKELFFLQVELLKLQEWLKNTGKTVIIVFEGRDSAGKGSTIKKFTENLNPRFYKVIALGIPTPDERKNWWDRYRNQIEKGKINFFDRSWYNRGLVEPVMGYGTPEEYEDFMENVEGFENDLVVDGDFLFKLWFSIDKETQAKRFDFRQKSPLKYWKYSENDEKMQDVWEKFTEYKEKLFDRTSTVNNPWVVLDSNDKKISGLNAIRYVLQNIPYTNKDEDVLNKDFPEAMSVLRPEINEQTSPVDFFNKYFGSDEEDDDEPNFMDTWSSMGKPKDQMTSNSGSVFDDMKKMMKTVKPMNDLTKDDLIVAATLWGEARGEGVEGMKAVANVIRNRADSLKKSPKDVVLQKKQFSIWNDTTTDNFLDKVNKSILKNPKDGSAWENAKKIVKSHVKTKGPDNTKGAQFYHTISIKPNWDYNKLKYTTTIGNHKFYKPVA